MEQPTEGLITQPGGVAERLRDLRTTAKLTVRALAETAGWTASKVSKIENGRQMPTAADLKAWTAACDAGQAVTDTLLAQIERDRSVRAAARAGSERATRPRSYDDLIAASTVVRVFAAAGVPEMLQTAGYARCMFEASSRLHGPGVRDADTATAERMGRQRLLYVPGRRWEFLLAEPALRWTPGPVELMRGQLDRLHGVIGVPDIRFGVLPMGGPVPLVPHTSFAIYGDVVAVETFIGQSFPSGPDVDTYTTVLDLLWESAVEGEDARALVVAAARALGG